MNVAIIKYNAGNIRSVANAIGRMGVTYSVTDSFEEIRAANRVIFPGVGEAATTMRHLRQTGLDKLICSLRQPVLGICLGMQLMCARSEENGGADCLGIFPMTVSRFRLPTPNPQNLKVPHMGWNSLTPANGGGGLFPPETDGEYVYFVHSYRVPLSEFTISQTDYIEPFSSAIRKDNFMATQFHPEKSGGVGEAILRRFVEGAH